MVRRRIAEAVHIRIRRLRADFACLCALVGVALPGQALAQAYQCRIPQGPLSLPQIEQDEPTRQMPVKGYTLAISWSPEFCRTRKDSASAAMQCSGRNGRFGMVLHGLWPEGGNGRWPQWCPTTRAPSLELLRRDMCISPSARLMALQWAKHGSCAFPRPETYFTISRILWNSLRFPDFDRLSRREGLDAGTVREAFVTANRSFKPEFVGLKLNRRGWLEELRICYGANFLPAKCGPNQFGPKDSAEVKIWRGL